MKILKTILTLTFLLSAGTASAVSCSGGEAEFYACQATVTAVTTNSCQGIGAHQEFYPCDGVLTALKKGDCSDLASEAQEACWSAKTLLNKENTRGCSDKAHYAVEECWGIQKALVGLGKARY